MLRLRCRGLVAILILLQSTFTPSEAHAFFNVLLMKSSQSRFFGTGGTITYGGGYTIHTFTSNGTFTAAGNGNVEYLVVGGGGASGRDSGGGGGGGAVLTGTTSLTPGNYAIVVGIGGIAQSGNGGSSSFNSTTADGGGAADRPMSTGTTAIRMGTRQAAAAQLETFRRIWRERRRVWARWRQCGLGRGHAGRRWRWRGWHGWADAGAGGDGVSSSISGAATYYGGGGGGGVENNGGPPSGGLGGGGRRR